MRKLLVVGVGLLSTLMMVGCTNIDNKLKDIRLEGESNKLLMETYIETKEKEAEVLSEINRYFISGDIDEKIIGGVGKEELSKVKDSIEQNYEILIMPTWGDKRVDKSKEDFVKESTRSEIYVDRENSTVTQDIRVNLVGGEVWLIELEKGGTEFDKVKVYSN